MESRFGSNSIVKFDSKIPKKFGWPTAQLLESSSVLLVELITGFNIAVLKSTTPAQGNGFEGYQT